MNAVDPRRGKAALSIRRPPAERTPGWRARLFAPLFHRMLDRIDQGLEQGSLDATLPDGSRRLLGGRGPGFDCVVDLVDWRAFLQEHCTEVMQVLESLQ